MSSVTQSGTESSVRGTSAVIRRISALILAIIGLLLIVVGIFYVTTKAGSLPSFVPGHIAGGVQRHTRSAGRRQEAGCDQEVSRRCVEPRTGRAGRAGHLGRASHPPQGRRRGVLVDLARMAMRSPRAVGVGEFGHGRKSEIGGPGS